MRTSESFVCLLWWFYVLTLFTVKSVIGKESDPLDDAMRCYSCNEGDFENCPAPAFGYCPQVPGLTSCPDERSVCYLTTTWSRTESSVVEFKKTCGMKERRDCRSTECSCFCLRRQYSDTSTKTKDEHEVNSIQFQDRYKSYLAFKPPSDIANELLLSFDIRPSSLNGYIVHLQLGNIYEYLILYKSHLVLRFDLGTGPATIKSKTKLQNTKKWYSVSAIRRGKQGKFINRLDDRDINCCEKRFALLVCPYLGVLRVDNDEVTGESRGSKTHFASTTTSDAFQLVIGSGPHPDNPSSHTLTGFSGCIRKLKVNGKTFDEMATRLLKLRSVIACDTQHPCSTSTIDCGIGGTCATHYPPSKKSTYCLCKPGFKYSSSMCKPESNVCQKGYLKCYNSGTCSYDGKQAKCNCRPLFTGRQCENKAEDKCLLRVNGLPLNKCVRPEYCLYVTQTDKVRCKCPIGRVGSRCEQVVKSGFAARFHRISYAEYKAFSTSNTYSTIYLEIKPELEDGLMLYVAPNRMNAQFFALGLKNARVEFVIDFGEGTLIVHHDKPLLTDKWYQILITRIGEEVSILLNGKHKKVSENYGRKSIKFFMTGKTIFIGGIPPEYQAILNSRYPYGFQGCIRNLKMDNRRIDLFRSALKGTDVLRC